MSAPQTLVDAALALSREAREELVQRLIESIEVSDAAEVEGWNPQVRAAWVKEANRRLDEYRRGEVIAVPHETVMADLDKRLGR